MAFLVTTRPSATGTLSTGSDNRIQPTEIAQDQQPAASEPAADAGAEQQPVARAGRRSSAGNRLVAKPERPEGIQPSRPNTTHYSRGPWGMAKARYGEPTTQARTWFGRVVDDVGDAGYALVADEVTSFVRDAFDAHVAKFEVDWGLPVRAIQKQIMDAYAPPSTVVEETPGKNPIVDAIGGNPHQNAVPSRADQSRFGSQAHRQKLVDFHPAMLERLQTMQSLLRPPWSRNEKTLLGWKIPSNDARVAFEMLMGPFLLYGNLRSPKRVHSKAQEEFLDLAEELIHSGPISGQSYWVRLLRDISPQARSQLLTVLARQVAGSSLSATRATVFYRQAISSFGMGASADEAVDTLVNAFLVGVFDAHRDSPLDPQTVSALSNVANIDDQFQRFRRLSSLDSQLETAVSERLATRSQVRTFEVLRGLGIANVLEAASAALAIPDFYDDVVAAGSDPGYGRTIKACDESIFTRDTPLMLGEFMAKPIGSWIPASTSGRDGSLGSWPTAGSVPVGEIGEAKGARSDALKVSVVLEGGGAKGMVYGAVLDELNSILTAGDGSRVVIDEYRGTSAGAIVAGFLAAGFEPKDLPRLMKEIDFESFYAGHAQLTAGANRTGLFSTERMYRVLQERLAEKLGLDPDKPILFRHLPNNLKVVTTVVATDLPDDMQRQLGIGLDGKMVFDQHSTPNADVVAAIVASAAVPLFFDAPKMYIVSPTERSGVEKHWIQFVDGGVVNNLPINEGNPDTPDTVLVMIPAYYSNMPKGKPYSSLTYGYSKAFGPTNLQTLDFSGAGLIELDNYNRAHMRGYRAGLLKFLEASQTAGHERAVIALNLTTPDQQERLIVQGRDPKETLELLALAKDSGLTYAMPPSDARNIVRAQFTVDSWFDELPRGFVDGMVDGSSTQTVVDMLIGTPQTAADVVDAGRLAYEAFNAKMSLSGRGFPALLSRTNNFLGTEMKLPKWVTSLAENLPGNDGLLRMSGGDPIFRPGAQELRNLTDAVEVMIAIAAATPKQQRDAVFEQ